MFARMQAERQRIGSGRRDAEAITVTGRAFGRDPAFYGFVRRLETYERVFAPDTTMVLRPDSDLLRYLNSPRERR